MEWTWLGPVIVAAIFLAYVRLLDRLLVVTHPARLAALVLAAGLATVLLLLAGRPVADGLAALAAAAVWSGCRRVIRRPLDGRRAAVRQGLVLAGLGVLLATWLVTDQVVESADDGDGMPPMRIPLRALPGITLATDCGTPVPAFTPDPDSLDGAHNAATEELFLREWQSAGRILRVADPDLTSNCHGWTFTGGRCWVRSEDVADILQENGYQVVDDPHPGDLAVYRVVGQVSHTGLVVGRSRDGGVLVESKWSWAGRFVHPAAVQPYAPVATYYRSPRPGGHLLDGCP